METLTRSASIHDRARKWRESGRKVALIPTRGTLHRGHMSLVAAAQDLADHVIVSIVGDPPVRDGHEADLELLAKVGADLVFLPPVQEIFPIGRELCATVSLPELTDGLEGAARPGQLPAITTLLVKLVNIVRPDIAVFGERDFQQLVMMRRLVDDLFLSVDVVGCPTWRDGDGLALASVNRELTAEQRARAPRLYATLAQVAQQIDGGARDYAALERRGESLLNAAGFATEYFHIRHAKDLAQPRPDARDLVILAAARLDSIRLIDSHPVRLIDRY
jgi:pantoate--beta-alanine ligase